MEWSLDNSDSRFSATFSNNDDKLKLSKLIKDDIENSTPDISVSPVSYTHLTLPTKQAV